MITVWTTHGYDKLRLEMTKPEGASAEYKVYAAKRETEGFHIALRSDCDAKDLCIKVNGGNDSVKVNLFHIRGGVLELDGKKYTDPAVPLKAGELFNLEADTTMAVLVEFTTSPETEAGEYKYDISVTDNAGNAVASACGILHVWNFEMPEKLTFETGVGTNGDPRSISLLREHSVSGFWSNFDILSDEADTHMSDPRITSFRLEDKFSDEVLAKQHEKLKTNPEWMKKAFFYVHGLDEPSTIEKLNMFEETYSRLRRLCPGVEIICPFYTDVQLTEERDQIDFMADFVDLHCPKLPMWDDEQVYSPEQMKKYPPFGERMKALQARGDTLWAYVCNIPMAPYLNVKVEEDGINTRVLFWQHYQRDIDGFLFWGGDAWTEDPYHDVDFFHSGWYGDGLLFYPGEPIGLTERVPSIRLKIMRDGIEDIELFYMAEKLLGREWVDAYVNAVTPTLTSIAVTSDEFADIRIKIGNAVEAALAK